MIFFIFLISLFFYSSNVFAYVGLGPLIPLLGNAIIFIFFALISIIGIFFYPLKKILDLTKNNKKKIKDDKENK